MSKKIMRIAQDGMLYVNHRLNEGDSFSINPNFVEIGGELIEGYPFVKPVIDDSLVLWLDGSTGNNYEKTNIWKDLSGNGNDGQLMNFDFTEDNGWVDGGLKFDGVDDYVQLPDLNLNPDNFTIQVDNKIRAFNGDKVMTENGDEWGRNLFIDATMLDVSNYEQIGAYHYFTVTGLEPTTEYTMSVRHDFDLDTIPKPPTGNRAIRINNKKENPGVNVLNVTSSGAVSTPRTVQSTEDGELYIVVYQPVLLDSLARALKLEKGSTATDWTPAPDDITETNIINHNTPFVENNTIHTLRFYNRALTYEEILQNYQAGQCSPLLVMRGEVIG